jgi:hypothetical protein
MTLATAVFLSHFFLVWGTAIAYNAASECPFIAVEQRYLDKKLTEHHLVV